MMKHLLPYAAALALLLPAGAARAQAPAWQTTRTLGQGNALVNATAADAAGNVYLAGSFSGTLTLGTTILTSAGDQDGFVARYQPATGTFAWAVRVGGASGESCGAIAVQGNSVYVAGYGYSPSLAVGGTTLAGGSYGLAFVARLADAGTAASFTWAQRVGAGNDVVEPASLAASGSSLYLAGRLSGSATIGGTPLTTAGSGDWFVTRLADAGSSGSFSWAVRAGGPGDDRLGDVAVQGSRVYVAGTFTSTATFGGTSLTSAGDTDLAVACLTDAGSSAGWAWAVRAGGTQTESAQALALGSGDSVYLTGFFASSAVGFGAATLTRAGTGNNVYVAKLTDAGTTGTFTWAQQASCAGGAAPRDLAATAGGVYVTGLFLAGPATFGAASLPGIGNYDVFVARLADAGSTAAWAWAQQAGSPDPEQGTTLAVSGPRLLVTGEFEGTACTFGPTTLTGPGNRAYTTFLAALLDPALPTRAATDLSGLSLYPNPAHHAATVRIPAGAGAATVQVLDVLGRVVRQVSVVAGTEYRLNSLAPGVYAVWVQVGAATAVQRLAVE